VLRPAGLRDKNAKEESKDLEICALECAPTRKSGGVLPHAFLLRKMVTNLDDPFAWPKPVKLEEEVC